MRIRHRLPASVGWLGLLASLLVAAPLPATAQLATPAVVINEVMQNPAAVSDGSGEFFELFNPGTDPVDIDGWTIADLGIDSHAIDNGGPLMIPAGGYLVLGNNTNTATNGGVSVDYGYGSDVALANGDDELILTDATTTEIDRIEWDGGPGWPDPTGASMSLSDPTADNNDGANWCESTSPYGDGDLGTPGAANDACSTPPPPAPAVTINEIRIDQPSADDDEFFELAGPAGTSLDGLTYLVIGDGTGGSGVIEAVASLAGTTIPADGVFLAAEDADTLGEAADLITSLNFENSDNVTHLLVDGFSGTDGQDLDTNDDGALDLTPWTAELDRIALVEEANPPSSTEYHYGPPQIGPDGSFVPGQVFRCPDGSGAFQIGTFDLDADDTPGLPNACGGGGGGGGPLDCLTAGPFDLISAIQGSGLETPVPGTTVTVEAVVVGEFQFGAATPDVELDGFYVQEEDDDADTDDATSEGVFVYEGNDTVLLDVAVGDLVRVRGTVTEFGGQTQIAATEVVDCGDVALPTPANPVLPFDAPTGGVPAQERFEGMAVQFLQTLHASEFFNLDRFGEIRLSAEEFKVQPTQVFAPGSPEQQALAELNTLDTITLDDGRTVQNPNPIPYVDPPGASYTDNIRRGQTVDLLSGVFAEAFGAYRIQTIPSTVTFGPSSRTRPAAPEAVGGDITVGSFNVLNYFTTIGSRGASNVTEFDRQTEKLVEAISTLDADVLGIIEVENQADDGSSALQNLVQALNSALGAGTYAAVTPGMLGGDAIRVGFIYKPASVLPVFSPAVLDSPEFVNDEFGNPRNRPALAQTFQVPASGQEFTAVVNHFKSKGDSGLAAQCTDGDPANDVADCDQGDGQGYFNATRTNAAEVLADWLATDPTGVGDPDVLILGDLNAYAMEDPIQALADAGYGNLAGADDYSFLFDGQEGTLDYALASASLAAQVSGVTQWQINADEADLIDYNFDFGRDQGYFNGDIPFRASDHDPVLVGLALGAGVLTCNGLAATIVGTEDADVLIGTVGPDVIVGLGGDDEIHGGQGDDVICAGEGDDLVTGFVGDDTIFGEGGNDLIDAGGGDDHVEGGDGDDELLGGKSDDVLDGGEGDDVVRGQGGRDEVIGGEGADTLYGNDGRDFLYGDAGDDILYGGQDGDKLFGGDGADQLYGSLGDDTLRGEAGDDQLFGEEDDDRLFGGPDGDQCTGGAGTNLVAPSCEVVLP